MGDVNMSGRGLGHRVANLAMDVAGGRYGKLVKYGVGIPVVLPLGLAACLVVKSGEVIKTSFEYSAAACGCSSGYCGTREDRR